MNLPDSSSRPAWIEVDLCAIEANVAAIQSWVGPGCGILAVVKANAYGHGLVPAARAAVRGGASALGVALVEEGVRLRSVGIRSPIVVLGCALPDQAEAILESDLSPTVSEPAAAEAFSNAASSAGRICRVHLKIDTGMGRIGAGLNEVDALGRLIRDLPGIAAEGISTHIAWERQGDRSETTGQIARFVACTRELARIGLRPRWRHLANSVTTVQHPEAHFNLVRVGLLTYGIPPAGGAGPIPLKSALSVKARVVQLRNLPAGQPVSYGGTFRTSRPTRIALLPIGYADGYSRRLSNRGWVLIHGFRSPVIGAVCMDHVLVDVTRISELACGDEAVLLGHSAGDAVTVRELACLADEIPHEVLSSFGPRLPRRFLPSRD